MAGLGGMYRPVLDPVAVAVLICVGGVSDELDLGVPRSRSPRLLGSATLVDVLSAVLALLPLYGLMAVAGFRF